MLKLKVNGEFIDLDPDAVITVTEESPLFGNKTVTGGFGFPFSVPVTPLNSRVLDFPERPGNVSSGTSDFEFQLFHSGKLRLAGTLTASEAGGSYECYLSVSSGDFAGKIGDKKLSDLDLGGERTWAFKSEFAYPTDDFTIFPLRNVNFMLDTMEESSFDTAKFRINAYENGAFFNDTNYTFAVTPFPFLAYIIKRIFSEHGFQIEANCFETDKDLRELVLYSTWDITELIQTTELIQIYLGLDEFGREIWEWLEVGTVERGLDKFNLVDSVPDVKISDFLKWLRNKFNVAFVIDQKNQVQIVKRQEAILAITKENITEMAIGKPVVVHSKHPSGFALQWAHDQSDALFSDPDFKKIDDFLSFLKDPVANTTVLADLTPTINEIRLVESLGEYYRYAKYDLGGGGWRYQWQHWSIGFQNYLDGEMEETFLTGLSTLRMVNWQREISGPSFRCPWAEQKGNGIEREESEPFSARLLFYRGMQPDSNTDDYPMGSYDNLDMDENQITGRNMSLKWEGEFGIYNQLYKNYLTWWLSRRQINHLIVDPSRLNFTDKVTINKVDMILKKRTINFSATQIVPSECEFYIT